MFSFSRPSHQNYGIISSEFLVSYTAEIANLLTNKNNSLEDYQDHINYPIKKIKLVNKQVPTGVNVGEYGLSNLQIIRHASNEALHFRAEHIQNDSGYLNLIMHDMSNDESIINLVEQPIKFSIFNDSTILFVSRTRKGGAALIYLDSSSVLNTEDYKWNISNSLQKQYLINGSKVDFIKNKKPFHNSIKYKNQDLF